MNYVYPESISKKEAIVLVLKHLLYIGLWLLHIYLYVISNSDETIIL